MTFEEEVRLLEKLEGQEWVIVTMAINTGMRQAEIFDLTWFDVDSREACSTFVFEKWKRSFVPINETVRPMLAEIFGWSDVRMALRYTHATDESERRAVENLVKPIGPSDESVKGKVATLP